MGAKEKPFLHSVVREEALTFRRACVNKNEVSDYTQAEKCDFFHHTCRENGVGLQLHCNFKPG